jgi:uncharacterized MAPEG superfamily protein
MIIAFWCVLIAGVMPLVCAYLAKFGGARAARKFDNHEPRVWLSEQTGHRGRANAAQANCFEAFPLFAVGVVICVIQHVPVPTIDLFAMIFIAARVVYIACYVADRPSLRSLFWVVGFAATVALYLAATTGTLR